MKAPAPVDPIAAVTHPDPYDYYGRLAAGPPLYPDDRLGLWIAASAPAVTAVLTSPACRVRPPGEPVPAAFLGTPAAAVFRHRIRLNDGEAHRPFKQAATAALDPLDTARVTRESGRWAEHLARKIGPATGPDRFAEFASALPLHVLCGLLGFADEAIPAAVRLAGDFVDGLSPGSTPEQTERAKGAAGPLWDRFRTQLHDAGAGSLLGELAVQARHLACNNPDVVVANGIGFLVQARDATAGLLGASLLALARRPDVRERIEQSPDLLRDLVEEVLRHDPPVQNTRRYVAEPAAIEGQELRPGEVVLVVLAAANHDPRANPDPDRFDVTRRKRQIFTLGVGPHTCPGQRLATTIVSAAVRHLLANGVDPDRLDRHPAYRPSANLRIPLLYWTKGATDDRSDL
jgi:cytochrome P450